MKTTKVKRISIVTLAGLLALSAIAVFAAGTLTESSSQSYVNGYDSFAVQVQNWTTIVGGTNRTGGNLVITNGGNTAISLTGVTTPGRVFGRDTSPSNTAGSVTFSCDGTNWLAGSNPGEPFSFRMVTNVLWASVTSTQSHTIAITILPN